MLLASWTETLPPLEGGLSQLTATVSPYCQSTWHW